MLVWGLMQNARKGIRLLKKFLISQSSGFVRLAFALPTYSCELLEGA
jgi:hypothetical protein